MSYKSNSCIFREKNEDDFLTWLVEILGPVLVGSKPAEIISLPKYDSQLINKVEKIEKYIGNCHRISYKIITYKNTSIKVLFYNPISLENHLAENRNIRFLRSVGYPNEYKLQDYLKFLTDKIKYGDIPSEIGVFLGYPLKDIIGFIGHPSLKLTKVNGWRVYGDPRVSDRKFNEFLDAKNKIRNLLSQYAPEKVLALI
jgi:hypothetical protein